MYKTRETRMDKKKSMRRKIIMPVVTSVTGVSAMMKGGLFNWGRDRGNSKLGSGVALLLFC